MLQTRVIPVLLLKGQGLYKTIKFKNPVYIGDPINAIKIFNEKEVDELVLLDIEASIKNKAINFPMIENIASEAFMPIGYGGGIRSFEDAKRIFSLGIEKIIINSAAFEKPNVIHEIAETFGNQSIVISLDVKKNIFGKYELYYKSGSVNSKKGISEFLSEIIKLGCGELLIHAIDRDGTMKGYDLDLLKVIAEQVNLPTIACGGAGSLDDFKIAIDKTGISAVAAGSFFVYHGKHKAVLITYPKKENIEKLFL